MIDNQTHQKFLDIVNWMRESEFAYRITIKVDNHPCKLLMYETTVQERRCIKFVLVDNYFTYEYYSKYRLADKHLSDDKCNVEFAAFIEQQTELLDTLKLDEFFGKFVLEKKTQPHEELFEKYLDSVHNCSVCHLSTLTKPHCSCRGHICMRCVVQLKKRCCPTCRGKLCTDTFLEDSDSEEENE
jgi:hypothetical protein